MLLALLAGVVMHDFTSADLQKISTDSANAAISCGKFKDLKADQLGVSVAELDLTSGTSVVGSYRGDQEMYPASVVKLFYMACAAGQFESKELALTPEFERGVKEMIVESDNDATGYVLECLTGATSGPELSDKALKSWMNKRQEVNRWFKSLGYSGVNACQKPWSFGPFGREKQGYGKNWELRNSLTPDSCTRLMSEIMLGKIVNAKQCDWMKGILLRPILADGPFEGQSQSKNFVGKVLPKGTKLYSKAGWTDTVRHDVAGITLADGKSYVITIFTKAHSGEGNLIPTIASEVLKGLRVTPRAE